MEGSKKKTLPEFSTEDEERTFRATADSTKYIDWAPAQRGKLAHLKP